MSSTSMLFSLVLLAFVKHVAGMRGSPKTESMIETEVTAWQEDPCAQFGAEQKSWRQPNICQCPKELPLPRNCKGRSGRSFNLKKTIKGGSNCRCEEKPSCKKFGAERNVWKDWCTCPKGRPRTTKECSRSRSRRGSLESGIFHLSKASKGCRCLSMVEALERLKIPVAASALRFCEALVEHGYEDGGEVGVPKTVLEVMKSANTPS